MVLFITIDGLINILIDGLINILIDGLINILLDRLINIFSNGFYEFPLILYFDIQSSLYIKATQGNLKMWSLSTFALYILVKIICTIHLWEKWDFLFIDSDLLYRGTFKTGLTTYLIPLPKIILLKRNKYISNSINRLNA